jgi:xanthine dehydrogenase accessory factor
MDEIETKMLEWHTQKRKQALATLVKVYGSAPQPIGAKMAVTDDLQFTGAVSGGCVEGDVIEQAGRVIKSDAPKLVAYGISDEIAQGVGLTCGGTIEVFIEPFSRVQEQILSLQKDKRLFAVLTVLTGKRTGEKQIILPEDDAAGKINGLPQAPVIQEAVLDALRKQKSQKIDAVLDEEACQLFCEVFSPPARLIVIGAVHIAIPLVELTHVMNFTTIVVDPRSVFANRERFPNADELVIGWPADELEKLDIDENTYIAVVSHDDKFDVPALQVALRSKARYIGALGSRATHAGRVQQLLEAGVPAGLISRIHAPIGLDIGASGAGEISLAIAAEMIAVKNGRSLPGKQ